MKSLRIFSFCLIFIWVFTLISCSAEPCIYETEEFSIKLDTSFKKKTVENAVIMLTNSKYAVICVREDASVLENGENITESEYADLICEKYPEYDAQVKQDGELYYLEYVNKAQNKKFYYNSYIIKGEECFYTISFAAGDKKDNSESHLMFSDWIKTVKVGGADVVG